MQATDAPTLASWRFPGASLYNQSPDGALLYATTSWHSILHEEVLFVNIKLAYSNSEKWGVLF